MAKVANSGFRHSVLLADGSRAELLLFPQQIRPAHYREKVDQEEIFQVEHHLHQAANCG